MAEQLALNLRLRDAAVFEGYHAGENGSAVQALVGLAQGEGEAQVFLWGAAQTGKTHLLQAVCHRASARGLASAYLPLTELGHEAEVLAGLEDVQVLALDDVESVVGRPDWERALFNLINGLRERGHRLVLASRQNPTHLPVALPDLASRLLWGPVFHLAPLDDEAKLIVLTQRAARRGFELPVDAARYMLRHHPRDLGYLLGLLDTLDEATLAAQRRATIPFIRRVLDGS